MSRDYRKRAEKARGSKGFISRRGDDVNSSPLYGTRGGEPCFCHGKHNGLAGVNPHTKIARPITKETKLILAGRAIVR